MPKITKRLVDSIKPGAADVFIWDAEIRRFGLRVKPSGGRSFVIQYRTGGGKSRRLTLGRFPEMTCEKARTRALKTLGQVADGADPAAERRPSETVSDLLDRYLAEHVTAFNKPSSAREFKRLVEKLIRPTLGRHRVKTISAATIYDFHRKLADSPRSANQSLSVLSKAFALGERWGLRPLGSNPVRGLQRYPETKRSRFFSDAELARIGEAITGLEREGKISASAAAAIRLLALSGCRLGEILNLRWQDVDFESGALRLSDTKTGPRAHSIGAPALAVLSAIPRAAGSPWVIAGADSKKPLSVNSAEKAWSFVRDRAKITDGRLHDLRHTTAQIAVQAGASAFLLKDKLGHTSIQMAARYVARDVSPLRALSDRVENRIAAAMGGQTASVAELPAANRPARAR